MKAGILEVFAIFDRKLSGQGGFLSVVIRVLYGFRILGLGFFKSPTGRWGLVFEPFGAL